MLSPRWAHYRNGCVKIGMGVIVRLVSVVAVRGFAFVGKIPSLKRLNECVSMITPGLVPWALKGVALAGLISD